MRHSDLSDDAERWDPGPRWCDWVADLAALGLAGLAVAAFLLAAFSVWSR